MWTNYGVCFRYFEIPNTPPFGTRTTIKVVKGLYTISMFHIQQNQNLPSPLIIYSLNIDRLSATELLSLMIANTTPLNNCA